MTELAAIDARNLRRLDCLIWAIVAAAAAIVLAAPLVSGFRIGWPTFLVPGIACAVLLAGGCVLPGLAARSAVGFGADQHRSGGGLRRRRRPALLPGGKRRPSRSADHGLRCHRRGASASIGRAMLDWMNAAPTIFFALRPIYLSLALQMTTVVLCLAFTGRLMWLRVYTLAFLLATLASHCRFPRCCRQPGHGPITG